MAIKEISAPLRKFVEKVLPIDSLKDMRLVEVCCESKQCLQITLNEGWEFEETQSNQISEYLVRDVKRVLLTVRRVPSVTE